MITVVWMYACILYCNGCNYKRKSKSKTDLKVSRFKFRYDTILVMVALD
jgi:hypothetical protein